MQMRMQRQTEYRPCQGVCVGGWVGGSWCSGALALCFFVPARLLEGQTPSFQTFDWGDAGGFDDQLQPLPCPALPCPALSCPAAPSPRVGYLLGWTDGRLAGLGWVDRLNGRVGWWVDGRLNVGSGMEPSPEHRCFSPHQAKRGLGLETRVDEDEETSTAHACCVQSTLQIRVPT